MIERMNDYARKLRILRQIQSNKAWRYSQIVTAQNIATVVVSSFLTFVGFSGFDKLQTYVSWFVAVDKTQVELVFNLFVFTLLVLVILQLVFRFADKQAEASKAVTSLSNLINEIDDILAREDAGNEITIVEADAVRRRYETLIQVIPPNSDSEYVRARKDYTEKQARKAILKITPSEMFDNLKQEQIVEALVMRSEQIVSVLKTLRQVDSRLFLGGGLIRNTVWDYLHGYSSPTPIDDIDVIYFDTLSSTKQHDQIIEQKLTAISQNLRWEVKNQARMHTINGDQNYNSLEDALTKWPETASAIAVSLSDDGMLIFMAPFGFGDLFRLIVTPTPHFRNKLARYEERIKLKNWSATWPRLKFIL